MLKGLTLAGRRLFARKGESGRSAAWAAPPGAVGQCLSKRKPRGGQLFPPRCFWQRAETSLATVLSAFLLSSLTTPVVAAAPPGAVISNQAQVDYLNNAGLPTSDVSNVVDVITAVIRSDATLELTRVQPFGVGTYQEPVGPSACFQAGAFINLADPVLLGGGSIDPTQPQEVIAANSYNLGEPLFLRLDDADQNVDAAVIDYAVVDVTNDETGDTETIRLTETGLSTGVFVGYISTARGDASTGDCLLQGTVNSSVRATYTDPADAADSTALSAALDPVSRVFESATGAPIDGTTIEIVDAVTGLPATIYGNDGISLFPSLITSGESVTDSSGTTYVFGPGEYRFPVVPPGNYQLIATPPGAYSAPSTVPTSDLQVLPGAPFSLGPGSFGNTFTQNAQVTFEFDIPVDPLASALFLQKTTTTTLAAPGDFVRYELVLENSSGSGTAANARIVDQLPNGVRYVVDSATRDGVTIPDPNISPDLSTLEFTVGDLAAGERANIGYVVEIVSGKQNDELVNLATAMADAGLVSNEADVRIRLVEDLFRTTSTLIGRVVEGHCSQDSFPEDAGVSNIRVYLEDGRFAVSDEGGRFHFEGLKPGTHVAQIDPDSVPAYYEVTGCDTAPQFSGRADSQFVRTHRGSLNRVDFYLRRKLPPEGQVDIELKNVGTESTEEVDYIVNVNGTGNVRIRNLQVQMLLPDGVNYVPGSIRIDDEPVADPRLVGPSMTISLPEQFGNWNSKLLFRGRIDESAEGELIARAFARFDSPIELGQMTPIVETAMDRDASVVINEDYLLNLEFGVLSGNLSEYDRIELGILIEEWQDVDNIQISAVGHSDSQKISPNNQHIFANNYVLSHARAMAAANFLAYALDVPESNISVEGRGADQPIASNATAEGRQANRRVELTLTGTRATKPSFLEVTKETSGVVIAETQGAVPGLEEDLLRNRRQDPLLDDSGMPSSQVEPPITEMSPGVALLLPQADFHPAVPVTKISVKHDVRQKVAVFLNGDVVNPLNFAGLVTNEDQSIAISRWQGVDIEDGVNTLHVVVRHPDGSIAQEIRREINYSGTAVRGEIVPELSTLVADGKTRPVVAVQLYDRTGEPARQGAIGTFRVEAPYRSWWEVEFERKNKIVAVGHREPIYRVGEGGVAFIELEPTTQAGKAELTLNYDNERQQEIRTWLSAQPRDWILVGFAEGTVGYNTLSDNMGAAMDAGIDDGYYDDGRVAFFAKGEIKGDYLLTLAYDSARDRSEQSDRFQTEIDPNAYYTLYADKSEQRFDAPSQRKLYVKLERNQFFALFGDYDTGMSITDLARYERRFNGVKTGLQGENAGFNAFATETNQSFMRDELRGDGTSGLYFLSSAPIIINSEIVRIEVRDRFDTGQVISSTTLSRFLDYDLDPFNGSLYFKQPVPSRDQSFNPVFIVAEYESESDANDGVIAGGRVSLRTDNQNVELGVSHINEGMQGAEADLTGFDLRWQVNPETLFKAEVASSSRIENDAQSDGKAMSASLEHQGEKVDVRAYMQEIDEGFGLGQQNTAEKGIRKVGVDGRAQLSARFFLEGDASWQQNLDTDAIRNAARAQLRYEREGFNVSSGLIHATDEFADGEERSSNQAEVGISKKVFDDSITLRANGSFSLSDDAGNADFPDATIVGADYRVAEGVDLFVEYEEASGQFLDSTMTRVGVRASPWSRAQINSSYTQESTEFGPRRFANLGLVQGFQVSENWIVDVGVDQSTTLVDPGLRQFDPDREFASGSLNEDFTAVFVGAAYSADLWSANSRVEFRDSDSEERLGVLAGWYREPSMGHSMSAGVGMYKSDTAAGTLTSAIDFRFGWAWRKAESRWSFLNRVDLIFEDAQLIGQREESQRIVNNLIANRRISARTQLSLQYAFKYVDNMFDNLQVSGFTDLIGIDFRRGFKSRWDWGAHTSVYHSYNSKSIDYGAGLDVGYNVRDNMWLTLGYNFSGFYDRDFANARYTAAGPYLQIAIKADQATLKAIAGQNR